MPASDPAVLLGAYDEQLRTEAEVASAAQVDRLGPLWLATFPSGRGFITYRDLDGADAATIRDWVGQAVDHFRERTEVERVEWKTRGHDHAPGLHESLLEHGFQPEEPESIMVGPAAGLAVDVSLPDGVTLRRIETEDDVRAMVWMAEEIFGDPPSVERSNAIADHVLQRLASGDGTELWVAEANGTMISSGRLEPVPGTEFAGVWGGSTKPEWRGRGIYRALTAERARSALGLGKTLIHSDSTEDSRPILERSGLIKVSTTTPYLWVRG